MAIQTFQRYELKYSLQTPQFEAICAELEQYMVPDGFCQEHNAYTIYNIYFDTEEDEVIRKSLAKPYYKEKLRLRSYTLPLEPDSLVFLELKKKVGKVVTKRRVQLPYGDAMEFIWLGKMPQADSPRDQIILEEIRNFLRRYHVYPQFHRIYTKILGKILRTA